MIGVSGALAKGEAADGVGGRDGGVDGVRRFDVWVRGRVSGLQKGFSIVESRSGVSDGAGPASSRGSWSHAALRSNWRVLEVRGMPSVRTAVTRALPWRTRSAKVRRVCSTIWTGLPVQACSRLVRVAVCRSHWSVAIDRPPTRRRSMSELRSPSPRAVDPKSQAPARSSQPARSSDNLSTSRARSETRALSGSAAKWSRLRLTSKDGPAGWTCTSPDAARSLTTRSAPWGETWACLANVRTVTGASSWTSVARTAPRAPETTSANGCPTSTCTA